MNKKIIVSSSLAGLLLPLAALAQQTTTSSTERVTLPPPRSPTTRSFPARTKSRSAAAARAARNSTAPSAPSNVGFGTYHSPHSEIVLRQSVAYTNPDNAGTGWSGSTRLAYDYKLLRDDQGPPGAGRQRRPASYGSTVDDTWAAGLEGGAKVFVKPQTFVFAPGFL
ncbi:MAG: hypothetical protein WDM96_17815 [Lacunisphaera sp.]